jgi:hypothetical protein
MSEENSPDILKYKKSPDYMTAYADGIVVQLGEQNVSRLMFYQVDADIETASNTVKNEHSLRFEVRIPREVLIQIAESILDYDDFQAKLAENVEGVKDETTLQKYYEFDSKIARSFFDPQFEIASKEKKLADMQDEFEDISERAKREKSNGHSE